MSRNAFSVADQPIPAPARAVPAPSSMDWRRPFRRLDAVLADAVAEARLRFGADAGHDSFRGLYVTEEDVTDSLRHQPGEPFCSAPRVSSFDPGWADVAAHHR